MQSPTIYAVAGSPAAGKTTFIASKFKKEILKNQLYLHDCDAVMTQLEGYQSDLKSIGPKLAFQNWELIARKQAEEELGAMVEDRRDIIYDRSCALPDSLRFLTEVVRVRGYRLVFQVLYVSLELAIERSKERESRTQRYISEDIIRKRLEQLSSYWTSYLELSDEAVIYDSSEMTLSVIASYKKPKLSVVNPELYEMFLSHGKTAGPGRSE